MEQTLQYKHHLIKDLSELIICCQLGRTIFVDSSQGTIEMDDVIKEKETIKFIHTESQWEILSP